MHIIPVYTGDNTLAAMVSMSIYILYMVVWASIGLVVISSSLHIDYYSAAFDHECVVGCAARAVCTSVFEFSIGCIVVVSCHSDFVGRLLDLQIGTALEQNEQRRDKTIQNEDVILCDFIV
jgi:hypothetical protein